MSPVRTLIRGGGAGVIALLLVVLEDQGDKISRAEHSARLGDSDAVRSVDVVADFVRGPVVGMHLPQQLVKNIQILSGIDVRYTCGWN